MRSGTLLLVSLLVASALAGCASNDGTTTTTTPATTSSTPVSSTPTSTTPTSTTPATPTPTTPAATTATIGSVVVLSAPDRVPANSQADVCFRVEGAGEIPHVAVHYDNASHPNATSFTEYAGGAAYPGGAGSSPKAQLPAVECVKVPVGTSTVYYRAHALNPPNLPGTLSVEKRIDVADAEPQRVAFVGDVPEVAAPNSNLTVCWSVPVAGGNATVPHTAIHYDSASHPNSTAFADYKGGAVYPANGTSADPAGYTLPGPFCSNLKMPASGTLYFRAHVLIPGTRNELSVERNVVAAPTLGVVAPVPTHAAANSKVTVCWYVTARASPDHVPHTALHWDTTSHPNATAFADYKGGAVYPDNATQAAASGYDLPGTFCSALTMPASGTLYFRSHVLKPNERNDLGDEVAIAVG